MLMKIHLQIYHQLRNSQVTNPPSVLKKTNKQKEQPTVTELSVQTLCFHFVLKLGNERPAWPSPHGYGVFIESLGLEKTS